MFISMFYIFLIRIIFIHKIILYEMEKSKNFINWKRVYKTNSRMLHSHLNLYINLVLVVAVVVQSPSYIWLFAIPWTAACQVCLTLTISQSLPKFMSFASLMASSHLILWCSLFLQPSIFPSIKDFSNESALCIRYPKYWSFNFSISSSNEYSGMISLKINGFDLLASKGLSGVFSGTIVWRHQFFNTLPSLWPSSHNPPWPLVRP